MWKQPRMRQQYCQRRFNDDDKAHPTKTCVDVFSRNFAQQPCKSTGLSFAKGEASVDKTAPSNYCLARPRITTMTPLRSASAAIPPPPQGFTDVENKGDMVVFHSFPQTVPHTRNKDSYPDLLHTSLDFFGLPVWHHARRASLLSSAATNYGVFKSPPPHQS